jgi:hypothetical protein
VLSKQVESENHFKQVIVKNEYENKRDLNLLNMLLNLQSNNGDEIQKPIDLFDIYKDLKELNYSNEFNKSLENSKRMLICRLAI